MHQTGFDAHEVGLMPYTADYFAISPHGHAVTHLDALCHVFWKGKMYNRFDASEVGSHGARKCAIDIASDGVVSRACYWTSRRLKRSNGSSRAIAFFPKISMPPKGTIGCRSKTHRPPAGLGIAQNQAPQVCTAGFGAPRAIAKRNDRHTRPGGVPLAVAHCFSPAWISDGCRHHGPTMVHSWTEQFKEEAP
jgi:hypothetical protein